jgi:arylsulfatase B
MLSISFKLIILSNYLIIASNAQLNKNQKIRFEDRASVTSKKDQSSVTSKNEDQVPITPQHVLWIVVDDLGFSDLSYKSSMYNISAPLFPTPFLDSLATAGVRLESTYVHALCSPSRTAFLSGRYAYSTGMNAEVITDGVPDQLPTNIRTLADLLKTKNWNTSAWGKYDIGMTTWGCTPLCRGFDNFSGFYNADEDYYTHSNGKVLDLRIDFDADYLQTGVHSTPLFASRASEWITSTIKNGAKNTFSYLAFQAIHAPQQAPDELVLSGPCADLFPIHEPVRRVACGQMRGVDMGVEEVIGAYNAAGILDSTLIIFTADNGGNTDTGGSNMPLRGAKATMFEGGVRAASFVSGAGLDLVAGTISHSFYSLVDWLPTIAFGIAGVDPAEALIPKHPYQPNPPPLDGMNIWTSLSTGSPSPRNEALLYLDPFSCFVGHSEVPCTVPGQGAIRVGNYKLIHGHVSQYMSATTNVTGQFCGSRNGDIPSTLPHMNITQSTSPPFCPGGWVYYSADGTAQVRLPPEAAGYCSSPPCLLPPTSSLLTGGTWLFDVVNDPMETTDLSSQMPDLVASLLSKLQAINSTNIPQSHSAVDPNYDPSKYNETATPWRGDPVPFHCDPNTTVVDVRSNFDGVIFNTQNHSILLQGWAWSPSASGHGLAPLNASFVIDGDNVGMVIANVARGPQFLNKTGAPNDEHGFDWPVPDSIAKLLRTGYHSVKALIIAPDGSIGNANKSPQCIQNQNPTPCK